MLGFAPLCSVPLCDIWGESVLPPDPWEDYRDLSVGAGIPEEKRKKKKPKKKKDRPSIEEMVLAIAAAPELGPQMVLEAMPRVVRRELPPDVDIDRLVQEVRNASAAVRAKIAKLYAELEEEDEDDDLLLLMM